MSFFRSRRSAVFAMNGAVATSQPLAAQAGLRILMDGGNAMDAAVSMAATLGVVEPMSTGIGGDVFCLFWSEKDKKISALNGSGRSARAANISEVTRRGFESMPTEGKGAAMSVTVPGALRGWEALLERFGRMTLREALAPAIDYAVNGFAVSEIVAYGWKICEQKLKYLPSGDELLLNGRAPHPGEIVRLPNLGKTLMNIAEDGADAFYEGEIARKIADFVQSQSGWLTQNDISENSHEWVDPISTDYRDVTVWECPPNGQGIAALIALGIAEGFNIQGMGTQSADTYHYLIESMRLGFGDALQFVADPHTDNVPTEVLLSRRYIEDRRSMIGERSMRHPPVSNIGIKGDTVYVSAIDGDGNACSLINSLYQGFGSGLVVPGTGISLQNRGALFSLDPGHPNCLTGGKRPYHTIIPALATRDGELWLSFGVMGGFQQPQGHLQVISNMVDFGMDPQEALDALRFSINVTGDDTVLLEEDLSPETVAALEKRGHRTEVIRGQERTLFGGGQIIERNRDTGVLIAGSEPRKDGCALGW